MLRSRFNKPIYKILIGVTLALASLQLCLGIVLGYLIGRLSAGKQTGQQGVIKSISFRIGAYRLHLHHWLVGLVVLVVAFVTDFFLINPFLFYGALGGYVFQGIFCYSDWKKILIKQK